MINFDVITVFPELINSFLKVLPYKKAIERELIKVNSINLRDFPLDSYGTIDDKPYGGGIGMLLMIEPLFKAINKSIANYVPEEKNIIIVTSPQGETYNQKMARDLKNFNRITIVCGRYEGMDSRIFELNTILDKKVEIRAVSLGDFVLSGGELPALSIIESVSRLLPGVLEKEEAAEIESFTDDDMPEFPQYTRPQDFMGLKVPEVLLSGNHKEIEKWRKEASKKLHIKKTQQKE
ncbi:tRNA (guanosine(37)-N1)-methyltransferase TrmD [Candidatus Nomurabacteria bacterium]|uniref:tRNA (guanine-N(1)-)-methyltransferase n=1 Tax=candidate division WWE3 bacterium TaxID=2053526 RepID=A0A955E1L0_UNCKA|nr:tRNA (guanosine(37)-N1)-methyltransferase TrmD [candidate division WWE3 bacterium]MCB9823728.1 tRNA (guanosine(37)-N1)-methyltransferase TrmD [Candidatus Nomurabacteria bacterium]MCB9827193.1 tRNA (guanosine(37)-N1)-methyltransferase TrmD [Candidatus Nomurabacteria bacterium]MCB9827523.1 tRNA (guanosine(37)-N1)-methyltransferase TrmD [Candidatus Nomurabacteria bacterium]HXK52918.1 tRNA (guanosine(37)-N1)-methyltransferase TrmD [bacterium]